MRRTSLLAFAAAALTFAACEGCGAAPGADGPDGGDGVGTEGEGEPTGEGEGEGEGEVGNDGGFVTDGGPFTVDPNGVTVPGVDGGPDYTCYRVMCAGHETQCGDCVDNDDGDGLVDFRDPECLGPCDNTEGPGLYSDVGGAGGNSCGVDCYFDYGNGSGGGDCKWDHRCDAFEPEDICPFEPQRIGSENDCPDVQPANCESYCKPFTPNGCDCFGCCTFPALEGDGPDGGPGWVWIGNLTSNNESTCTLASLDDEAACPKCTPVANCLNECGRCELCVGKTTVPDDCFQPVPPDPDGGTGPGPDGGGGDVDGGGGGGPTDGGGGGGTQDAGVTNPGQCPVGIDACGLPGQSPCDPGYYCVSGCCRYLGG